MDNRRTPVLVGVGQVLGNRAKDPAAALEPLELIARAVAAAGTDSDAPALLREIDHLDAVRTTSWAYADLPALLAEGIGAHPTHTASTTIGGHWPAELLDVAAARIAAGDSRVALVVGGETQASVTALARAGLDPPAAGWTAAPGGPPDFSAEDLGSAAMGSSGIFLPTRVYPLFESALRHRLGHSVAQALAWSAELYAAFSEVAAANPVAWDPQARTAEDIATVGPRNRMVCEPYPLSMNANPNVDQAAAVLVTSLAVARAAGVPDSRLVFVRGGFGAHDTPDVLQRSDFAGSAAMTQVLSRCQQLAGDEAIDLVDVYSCFPVVPKLVSLALGLPRGFVPSVTGGHAAFGGPLSSYTLHSIVAVTQRLRAGARLALVHGNGGYLTHQHALLLASGPHPEGYVGNPTPVAVLGVSPPVRDAPRDGFPVVVEAATVEWGKDGLPLQGFLVARDSAGARIAGQTAYGDGASAAALSTATGDEIVGVTLTVRGGIDGLAVSRSLASGT